MSEEKFDFGRQDIDSAPAGFETKADLLRKWYRIGQRFFREHLADNSPNPPSLLDHKGLREGLLYHEEQGFLMGWQSDKYAYDNNLPLSVEGSDQVIMEDLNGSTYEDEGRTILADASQG